MLLILCDDGYLWNYGNSLWHYLADLASGVEFLPEIEIPVGFW